MTMAISRHGDNHTASFKLDDFGAEGVCTYDLVAGTVTLTRGTLGSLSGEELAFRIWNQMTPPNWSNSRCRKEWANRAR